MVMVAATPSDIHMDDVCREIGRCARTAKATTLLDGLWQLQKEGQHDAFPHFYAALLLARVGAVSEAHNLLRRAPRDTMCLLLARSLAAAGTLHPGVGIWDDMRGAFAWTATDAARKQRSAVTAAIDSFSTSGLLPIRSSTCMLDLGCGDGRLSADCLVELSLKRELMLNEVVLVDHAPDAVETAVAQCALCKGAARVRGLQSPLEQLGGSSDLPGNQERIALASGCLHHLPENDKLSFLRQLRSAATYLVLTELQADHDQPAPASPRLAESVFRFYGSLVADVYSTRTTSELKDVCVQSFLLPEALQALASEYADRGNFHTTIGHWLSLAGSAGWRYIAHRDAKITPQGLISTTTLFGR